METIENTRILKTPSGLHAIEAKSFLTGADKRANRKLILEVTEGGKSPTAAGIDAAENALMEQVIVSLDGSADNIIQRVLAMRAEDYDFIIDTVNGVAQGLDKKKEKVSEPTTETSSPEEKQL